MYKKTHSYGIRTRIKKFKKIAFECSYAATIFNERRELIPQYCTMIMQATSKNCLMDWRRVDVTKITGTGIMRVKVSF